MNRFIAYFKSKLQSRWRKFYLSDSSEFLWRNVLLTEKPFSRLRINLASINFRGAEIRWLFWAFMYFLLHSNNKQSIVFAYTNTKAKMVNFMIVPHPRKTVNFLPFSVDHHRLIYSVYLFWDVEPEPITLIIAKCWIEKKTLSSNILCLLINTGD